MEEKMRLQKYMSQLGLCSRRRAEELIQEGKVKVNGEIITQMGHMVNGDEKIEIEGIENKDIIAFGDSLNDIDMIKNCGIGVAMGNSLERIKEIANYTTISHNENGVVEFLEKIYGGNNEISSAKSE